ncbi:hypothetical protein [Candidatus Accumulibacter sp. ACC005]|uniref:hypothetical protein n=1 Tax=Candidatus Accumulibacter sp. ACC005 TaxID=2823331 RepID=UPI0025BE6B6A|nr:hypothetical protein [Candidatus Accumulibacter sp. ACC005]
MVSHHEVILSAPRDLAVGGAPAILQRSDEDFIEAVLTRLRDADGRIGLRASLARSVSVAGGTDTRPSSKRNSGRGLFNKLRDASRQLGLAGGRVAAPPVLESAPGSDQQLVEGIRRSAEGAQVLKLFHADPAPVQPGGDGSALRHAGRTAHRPDARGQRRHGHPPAGARFPGA